MDTHRIITTLNPKLADVKPFTKVDEYYMEIEYKLDEMLRVPQSKWMLACLAKISKFSKGRFRMFCVGYNREQLKGVSLEDYIRSVFS